jgi:hypothetical protein
MMQKPDRRILAGLLALLGCMSGLGLDWPVDKPLVLGEFGSSLMGLPFPGLVLGGSGLEVRTASASELAFARRADDPRSRLPSAFGDFLVSQGRDGVSEVYGHIPEVADPGARSLAPAALVGRNASAGLFEGEGFTFSLFDRSTHRWVNPRVFLEPLADKRQPVIRRVSLEGTARTYVLGEQRSLPQGSYAIVIEAGDPFGPGPEFRPGPPWYLRVLVDGERRFEARCEIASTAEGRLSFYPAMAGGQDLVDVTGRLRLPPELFTRGRASIEVLVRDFAGNERSIGWTVQVE